MKPFLVLISIVLIATAATVQTGAGNSDIEVREFSWSYYKAGHAARSDFPEATRTREEIREREMLNRDSIENRSRDMRVFENRARRDSVNSKPVDIYGYKVTLRNNGTRVVKVVFWDYQFSDPTDPENPSNRQFRCVVKISPRKSATMEALSYQPPIRVVRADGGQSLKENLVINRVEFSDGSSWQRPEWYLPEIVSSKSTLRGNCQPL